ncbi:hypothetical protein CFP56_040438, partial [Quercus suber]
FIPIPLPPSKREPRNTKTMIKLHRRIGLSTGQIMRPDASQRSEAFPANRTKPRPEIKLRR